MKAKDIQLFSPIKIGKEVWTVIAVKSNKALIKSPDGKMKWVGINRIKML